MINPTVQKFIDELKGKRPFLTTDTQVLIGPVVLTASPDIHCDPFTKLSIEMPREFALDDFGFFILFIKAVFGSEYILVFQPCVKDLIRFGKGSTTKVEGLHFKAFVRSENYLATVEPIHPEQ